MRTSMRTSMGMGAGGVARLGPCMRLACVLLTFHGAWAQGTFGDDEDFIEMMNQEDMQDVREEMAVSAVVGPHPGPRLMPPGPT